MPSLHRESTDSLIQRTYFRSLYYFLTVTFSLESPGLSSSTVHTRVFEEYVPRGELGRSERASQINYHVQHTIVHRTGQENTMAIYHMAEGHGHKGIKIYL